ncbi:MAG: hypothetical protein FJ278_03980 [Planctomycetes bacterium]|nr:hypothetical protein [Planctomycetota bacterium]
MNFRERLLDDMASIRTVDCHSHTSLKSAYYKAGPRNLFNLISYFARDVDSVRSSFGPPPFPSPKTEDEQWQNLKAVLGRARNVSYWRHHLVLYRDLFGFRDAELNDKNWQALNETIKQKSAAPGWYDHVTRDWCRLETQVRNIPWFEDWEPEYFTAILRLEPALQLCTAATRESLEKHLERSFKDLASLKQGLADLIEEYRKRGSRGIKLAHAYSRTLASEPVPEPTAAQVFDRALSGQAPTPAELKQFQDHLIFYFAGLAGDLKLVFQIHTGVQGNWGNIPDSDPLRLIPLLNKHRSTRFDLFHAGYPYSREIGMLGKHFPNVWLNMCWMYLITMEGSRQTLSEWIDLVPGARILGFGSDVHWPEMIYGHLLMARSCLADVLAEKVRRDFLSEEAALSLTRQMLRDNGMELYRLGGAGLLG